MFTPVRVAALSLRPQKWDKAANADKLEQYVREAAREEPQLIVAPEGFLEGYVVYDVIRGERAPAELLAIAEPLDGPVIHRFRVLARTLRVCLCFGFAARVDDQVYNTAVFLGPQGEICGTYEKAQFAEGTHESWYWNRIGKRLRAFDTPLGRVGMLICNDRWNPLIARTLVLDGARLLLIPTYGNKNSAQNKAVLARARENGVPVVEANVGMNLIVSKGEIVAYQWGYDRITTAVIEVPAPPSPAAARALEQEYLAFQEQEMARRYAETMASLRKRDTVPVRKAW